MVSTFGIIWHDLALFGTKRHVWVRFGLFWIVLDRFAIF
jgi:hypothetical protein